MISFHFIVTVVILDIMKVLVKWSQMLIKCIDRSSEGNAINLDETK